MLPRRARLRASEVEELMRKGKSLRGRYISAKVLGSEDGTMRCAAVAPKATARKAAERNRLRRALYRAIFSLPTRPMRAAILIKMVPEGPLTPAFLRDLETLFS